jgi:hypothetical protein
MSAPLGARKPRVCICLVSRSRHRHPSRTPPRRRPSSLRPRLGGWGSRRVARMKDGNEGSFRVLGLSGENRTTTIDRRAARNAVAGRGYKAGRFT